MTKLADVVEATAIRPFQVSVPEAELTELRRRINATRWPEREPVSDASQGVQLATMQKLADYWATKYDWRKCEARLTALPHFVTEIDGLDIHFIHVRSKTPHSNTCGPAANWICSSMSATCAKPPRTASAAD